MSYLKKLAASRMDKEIKRLLSNNEFEKAMDIYRKHNIVRSSGVVDELDFKDKTELNELLHYSPLLDLSKTEKKEYLDRIKKLDRSETNAARAELKRINDLKPSDKEYYLKRHTHNPLKSWKDYTPREEPGNNYVYGHHGGYNTLDLAINRQNKAVQSVLGTNENKGRAFFAVVDKAKPNEITRAMDNLAELPNEYSMATSLNYGDVPGAVAFHSKGKAYHDTIGYGDETPLKGKRIIDDVKKGKVDMKLVRHDYNRVYKSDLKRAPFSSLRTDSIKKYRLKDNNYAESIRQAREHGRLL